MAKQRQKNGTWQRKTMAMSLRLSPLVLAMMGQAAIAGPTIMLDDNTALDYSLTLSYTGSQRLQKSAQEYLRDPNYDDGTRNFKRGSFINNRLGALGEVRLKHDNLGAILSGSTFYDAAYHGRNDNNSPGTVNKLGSNDRFTDTTTDISGQKSRLLDAYLYGSWALDEQKFASLKVGRHVLAWGESMFWPNISQGQAPVDATKFNVPGTEAKEGYLPVGQLSGSLTLNPTFTLEGFYQYKWENTKLNPVGDYFGSDFFGPGAEFLRFAPGAINSLPSPIAATYGGEVKPRDSGQWGLGTRVHLNQNTEIGLYHYRYHDRVGAMFFDFTGATRYSSFQGLGQSAPSSFKLGYFDDIKLTGLSLSTKFGDAVQMGADLSYRDGAAVYVDTPYGAAPARGGYVQANVNALYIIGPTKLAHQTTLMGELVHQRITGVDPLSITGGAPGQDGTYRNFEYKSAAGEQTRSSTLLGVGALFDYPSIAEGWDLTTKVILTANVSGSAMSGMGRNEKRLTLGADFKRLGNFTVGVTYAGYFGSPDIAAGRTMADRDYVSLNIKQTF